MYNTNQEYNNLVYEDGVRNSLKIYINGNKIEDRYILGLDFTYELFTNKVVELGGTPMQTCKLKLYKDAWNEEYTTIYIVSGINEVQEVPIGYFEIKKVNDNDDKTIEIEAEDYMSKFDFNYDASKLVPITTKILLQKICEKAEVELRFYFFY